MSIKMGRKRRDVHRADKGKGHDKYKSKRPKLSFNELLAKYKKEGEANIAKKGPIIRIASEAQVSKVELARG